MKTNRFPAIAAVLGVLTLCVTVGATMAAEATFPFASRIGLVPPPGMAPSRTFPGFEDVQNSAYIRLVPLPAQAFADLERSLTDELLKKQRLTVLKREQLTLPSGNALLLMTRQQADSGKIIKWLMIAPLPDLTALVSLEVPEKLADEYSEQDVRKAFASLVARATVPKEEQLALLPFKIGDDAGLRLVRVVPGAAAQLTDGPNDAVDATEQAHLLVSIAPGGPKLPSDRDNFARMTFSGLPSFKDIRLVSSEPMRIGGMPGHELRARAKDPNTGTEVEIVQWLRFGMGAYMRIVGFGPRENWTQTFHRFRAVRDGVEPR